MVPHFFMIDVDCGAQALPIIAISTLNPSHISYPWYVFFLYIVVCSIMPHTAISILSSWFFDIKNTTKSYVVGCHIDLSTSFTARNQSPIPVDCCVNTIFPLMSSIISFIAKMVVQRRICEVPTQRQKLVPCWSNPHPTPSSIINLIYSCLLSDCWLLYCSRHSQHYYQYQTRWKFTQFFWCTKYENRALCLE